MALRGPIFIGLGRVAIVGHREDYWQDYDAYYEGDRYISDRDAMPYLAPIRKPILDPLDEVIDAIAWEKNLRQLAAKRARK